MMNAANNGGNDNPVDNSNFANRQNPLQQAITFHRAGQLSEAIHWYNKNLELNPKDIATLTNMGVALQTIGRRDEAIFCYQKAIEIKPDFAQGYSNLGVALQELNRFDEAVECFKKATIIQPNFAQAYSNLGDALRKKGDFHEAVKSCKKALAIDPNYADAYSNLGNALKELKILDEAVASFQKAIAINPNYAEAYSNLGIVFQEQNKLDQAITCYNKALAINPNFVAALSNLGNAQLENKDYKNAAVSCRKAIAISPDYAKAYSNLGFILKAQDNHEEAISCFQKALSINPDILNAHTTMIYCIDIFSDIKQNLFMEERQKWNKQFAEPLQNSWGPFLNDPDPDRKLRIGYVGSYFRYHSAGNMFGPVILNQDLTQFEVYCYAGNDKEDKLTKQLKERSTKWVQTSKLNDEELAKQIKKDGIDIVVDLAGHMEGSRLLAYAYKPAPVQVSAWGYPFGTGIKAIDYIFSDAVGIPTWDRPLYTEKIIDLSCLAHYNFEVPFPDVEDPPACKNGYITFGAFNRLEKNNPAVYSLWSELLRLVPTSKLLIKSRKLDDPESAQEMLTMLQDMGIASDRLIFMGESAPIEHLKAHRYIDIMLDPFPQTSGMTALESLRMGVPLLTCEHKTRLRTCASILHTVGLDDWRAKYEDDFLEKGVKFSQDIDALKELRHDLRNKMDSCILSNSPLYTKEIEANYRKIWKVWCESRGS
ncbi:MAG: tetratricopeptide repeat protein [Magnetococcales bacterium]|nr:tetratricopeptide repeat protein [Magnetococcales bacterium]